MEFSKQWLQRMKAQNKYLTPFSLRFRDEREESIFRIQRYQMNLEVMRIFNMLVFLNLVFDFVLLIIKDCPWQAYVLVYGSCLFWSISSFLIINKTKFSPLKLHFLNTYTSAWAYIVLEIYVQYNALKENVIFPIVILSVLMSFFFSCVWYVEVIVFSSITIVHLIFRQTDYISTFVILFYYTMLTYTFSRIKRNIYHEQYLSNIKLEDFINLISNHIDLGVWILEEETLNMSYENSMGKQILTESEFSELKALVIEKQLNNLEEKKVTKTIEVKKKNGNTSNFFFASIHRFVYLGISSILIVFFDVTPAKKMEQEIMKLSEVKQNVIASVSHDIRTPLNASISMNELALKETSDPRTKFKLEIAIKSQKLLLFFITDFMDFHKLQNMPIEGNYNKVLLKDIVRESTELFYTIIQARGLEFFLEIYVDPNIELFTDEQKLKRILINLISNAMKYTVRGYISLRILAIKVEDECFLEFSVIDTGIGISLENKKLIFEKFIQVNDLTNGRTGLFEHGIGLGLSISNEMIKCLNTNENFKRIFLESKVGEGSIFSFYLPIVQTSSIFFSYLKWEKPQYKRGKRSGMKAITEEYMKRNFNQLFLQMLNDHEKFKLDDPFSFPINHFENGIMIVEDEETNIMVLKMYLKEYSNKVAYLRNGRVAVDFFKRVCEGKIQISKIFMDLNMPEMNGKDATRKIRSMEDEHKRKPIDIIALTANTIEVEDENELNNYGFTKYEMKPISKEKFINHVDSISITYRREGII